MNWQEEYALLTRDGEGLTVPCSRYGRTSGECATVAITVSHIIATETNAEEGVTPELLDYVMGLVVNDHDDPQYLIDNYYPSSL
jgi:hypothetical protein